MRDLDIIAAARFAEDSGDFSEIKKMAEEFLKRAQSQWAPHEAQDRKHQEYHKKPWWKRLFLREPFGGALSGRMSAADDLRLAEMLQNAIKNRNVRAFTDRL